MEGNSFTESSCNLPSIFTQLETVLSKIRPRSTEPRLTHSGSDHGKRKISRTTSEIQPNDNLLFYGGDCSCRTECASSAHRRTAVLLWGVEHLHNLPYRGSRLLSGIELHQHRRNQSKQDSIDDTVSLGTVCRTRADGSARCSRCTGISRYGGACWRDGCDRCNRSGRSGGSARYNRRNRCRRITGTAGRSWHEWSGRTRLHRIRHRSLLPGSAGVSVDTASLYGQR